MQSLQRAAKASLEWFEGADRYRSLDPEQFVFSMLTRSQRVTYDNLRVRDARYMEQCRLLVRPSDHGFSQPIDPGVPPMFHPLRAAGPGFFPIGSWCHRWTNTPPSTACPMSGTWCISAAGR